MQRTIIDYENPLRFNNVTENEKVEMSDWREKRKHDNYIVTRHNRTFDKEQASDAAKSWTRRIARDFEHRTDIVDMQRKLEIFFVTLAESIWLACQDNSVSQQSTITIHYNNSMIKNALHVSGLFINENHLASLENFKVNLHDDGCVRYVWGIFISVPEPSAQDPHLPNDDVIKYRDMLSTITTGMPQNAAIENLYSLLTDLLARILVEARPDTMTVDAAKNNIIWNNSRFFQQRIHTLLKTNLDVPAKFGNIK